MVWLRSLFGRTARYHPPETYEYLVRNPPPLHTETWNSGFANVESSHEATTSQAGREARTKTCALLQMPNRVGQDGWKGCTSTRRSIESVNPYLPWPDKYWISRKQIPAALTIFYMRTPRFKVFLFRLEVARGLQWFITSLSWPQVDVSWAYLYRLWSDRRLAPLRVGTKYITLRNWIAERGLAS